MGDTTLVDILRGSRLLPLHRVLPAMRGLPTTLPHPIRQLEPVPVLWGGHGLQRPVWGIPLPRILLSVGGHVLLQPRGRHQPEHVAGLLADPQLSLRQLHPRLLGLHLVPELHLPDPRVPDGYRGVEGGRVYCGIRRACCILCDLLVRADAAVCGVESAAWRWFRHPDKRAACPEDDSVAVIGEIFAHSESVKIPVILNPTGYTLTSSAFA